MRFRIAPLALLLCSAAAAHADSVSFTLLNNNQTATAGSTLYFTATTTAAGNNTGTEYLNGLTEVFTPALPSNDINDDAFFNTYPLSLNAGQAFTGQIFSFFIPGNASAGTVYKGLITLQGGSNPDAQGTLGSGNVSVTVTSAAMAATPEPSSLVLAFTGLGGVAFAFRRRLFAQVAVSSAA